VSDVWLNIVMVVVFVLIGGFFSGTELALISLRESQVRSLSEQGRRGAALRKLLADPNRFLATVQIGVTLATLSASAFGAETLNKPFSAALVRWGVGPGLAGPLAFIVVTAGISYLSLVLGELTPKRLALQRAEGLAMLVSPSLNRAATLARPIVWVLSTSTNGLVRLVGADPKVSGEAITQEELRDLVAAHESLSSDERRLIDEVFRAGDREVREVMTPRTEVEFLEASMTASRAAKHLADSNWSRFPVMGRDQDDVVGFVHVRDLLLPGGQGRGLRVADVMRDVALLPGTKKVLPALSEMRREGHHIAVVVDEYGGTAGIVTLEDLIEEVIGDIRDEYDVEGDEALRFRGGEVEADGLLNLDEVHEQTGVRLPDGPYETLAGFVMACLGHVPGSGEAVEVDGHRLEVTELDGRRVARVRVTPLEPAEDEQPGQSREQEVG
jgi:putative hemolysin